MKFKVNKIAAAVAVSLGTSVVGMNAAQADEILFPYVVASDTVTTIVSTINILEDAFSLDRDVNQLHYRYYYKNGPAAGNNGAACNEVNERLPSSPNDIVTFDVANRFGKDNLGILFEDVATSRNVNYGSKSFSLLDITLPVRAFLVVDNNDFLTGAGLFSTADTLAGEAIVLEFMSGAAWGYAAYNAAGVYRDEAGFPARQNLYDFSDFVETQGEVIANSFVPVALAPFNVDGRGPGEFITRFFVTPIAATTFPGGVWNPGNQLQKNLSATVRLAVQDPSSATQDVIFDRDEMPVSGQVPQTVVCVGAVDAHTMLSEGALRRVPDGGWSNLVVSSGAGNATNEAIVIKLEYNPDLLELDSDASTVPVVGVINNAIWLRKGIRESVARPLTLYGVGLDMNSPVSALQ